MEGRTRGVTFDDVHSDDVLLKSWIPKESFFLGPLVLFYLLLLEDAVSSRNGVQLHECTDDLQLHMHFKLHDPHSIDLATLKSV